MPIYEYKCPKCEVRFEMLRSLSQNNDEVACPHCDCKSRRVLSTFAAFTRGAGEEATSVAGGNSCSGCASSSCSTCH